MTRFGRLLIFIMFVAGMVFLVAPIVVVVLASFTAGNAVAFPPEGWSTRWYAAAASRTDFIASLGITLLLAVVVTLISLVLGMLTALPIVRGRFPGRGALGGGALAPLFVPHVVIGFAALPILAAAGLLGSLWGVLIAYLVIVFPLVVRSLVATLQGLDPAAEEAAQVFGASPARAFLTGTLPLATRGLVASGIFSFVVVLDEAVIINFIGGVDTVTFPMRLFSYIAETNDPIASVFATLLIVVTTTSMLVLDRLIDFDRLGDRRT